jgi:hypothetical protein
MRSLTSHAGRPRRRIGPSIQMMVLRCGDSDDLERISNGDDVLSTVILGMIPSMFQVDRDEVESLELRHTVADD